MKVANTLLGSVLVALLITATWSAYADVRQGHGSWAFVLMFGTLLVVGFVMLVGMMWQAFPPRR